MHLIRDSTVDITRYLPEYITKDVEIKGLLDTDSEEHEQMRLAINDLFNQFFISTATWGLSNWERVLALSPKSTDDFEQRRNRILLKLQSHQTTTAGFLAEMCRRYCSQESDVSIKEHNPQNAFEIVIKNGAITYLEDLEDAVETYKPAHLAYYFRFIVEFADAAEDFKDIQDLLVTTARYMMADNYPWPTRVFDGSWRLGGRRYVDGKWMLDGSAVLDGSSGAKYRLDNDIEKLMLTHIRFPNLADDFGTTAQLLNGLWNLDGENRLGGDVLPMDANGQVTVRHVHYLDGSWKLNGGDLNYLDGSIYLDGRADMTGGGIRLKCSSWTDILDGSRAFKRVKKIIPHGLLHPRLDDSLDSIEDGLTVVKRLTGIDFDDSTGRPLKLNEGVAMDGSFLLGDNITPLESGGEMEVRKVHRLNGLWNLDGGDRLRLDGAFYLDGTEMLSRRGNYLEISRKRVRI